MSDAMVLLALTEAEAMLVELLPPAPNDRGHPRSLYPKAEARLTGDVAPGFPDRTPGNGEPGGGHGANVTPPAESDAVGPDANTITERLALRRLPELDDLEQLRAGPLRCVAHTAMMLRSVGAPIVPDRTVVTWHARLDWTLHAVRRVIPSTVLVARCTVGRARAVHRPVDDLHRIARRWGYDPAEPTDPRPVSELLATDLTGQWCTSCLRVGAKEHRWRGDLCKWCYEFNLVEGFIPPADIITAHHEWEMGRRRRITEAMVEPHRQRHRDRRKARA